jgi:hypothetical protein
MIELIPQDIEQLKALGISKETLEQQYKHFEDGINPVELVSPANVNNGIIRFNKQQLSSFEKHFKEQADKKQITRFVPASGAASRMFKAFFQYLDSGIENQEVKSFAGGFRAFAFYNQIKCKNEPDYSCAINNMINIHKLADLPKALIPFHSYAQSSRTALEEHLAESALILDGVKDINIHFTVSESHQNKIDKLIQQNIDWFSETYNCNYNISFSFQSHATDTVAVNSDNQLKRNSDGSLIFRPGGHGSLLLNLNNLNSDLVFIKNIDNVQPDHLKAPTVLYKKILAGYLLSIQTKISNILVQIDNNKIELTNVQQVVENELNIRLPESFNHLDTDAKIKFLHAKLNRPLRVCGMVKNEGEPGGGPFWVRNANGEESLQIVESSQIDMQNKEQAGIFQQSAYFNPVDIVCWLKDYQGNSFNLNKFIDPDTAFISEKSQDGQTFKVLEHPGLWNGAMANWITLFVEVPISTFSPVKTITDLLRPQHQPG